MKKFLLLAVSLLLGIEASATVVKDIKVIGNQRISLGAILLNFPVNVGDDVDQATISENIRKLYSTGSFDDVAVTFSEGNVLNIMVKERPTISTIEFAGNEDVKQDKIEPIINDMGVRVGEALDRSKISEMERALTDFYHSGGKYQAFVKVLVTELPRNRVKLRIQFAEGRTARVQQINIIGNKEFTEKRLLNLFDIDDDSPWYEFFTSDKYSKPKLEGDLEKLRSFYLNRGYIRFDIKDTDIAITPDKKGIYVTLNLNEGDVYTVDHVTLNGDLIKKEDEIRKLVDIEEGETYSQLIVSNNESRIASYVGKFCYSDAQVKTFPEINDENKTVILHMFVNPGPRVSVNQINITGNKVTKDVVIRRELRQFEGSWLSNEKIEQSKTRLSRLGFFETVDITPHKIAGSDDVVDIDVKVKERQVNSISGSIGYGTVSKISFGAKLSQDNVLGTGMKGEIEWNWIKDEAKRLETPIIGYVNYFLLINGFESTLYMSKEEMNAHALRYSQTYKSKTPYIREQSKWTTDFDDMARKTVIKLNLSKNGVLSTELQDAIRADQSVMREENKYEYTDNDEQAIVDAQKAADVAQKFQDFDSSEEVKNKKEGKK
jgi:outer membrane protein insertion porin family